MPSRRYFIDNLRIFATCLVVLHHLSMSYGATGDWYYVEGAPEHIVPQVLLTLFTSTNQAFFMGLFFFLSAFFVGSSYDRKGFSLFLRDRLVRLGIPMVATIFLLNPIVGYIAYRITEDDQATTSLFEYISSGHGQGLGPMWFVETLILFSVVYAALRRYRSNDPEEAPKNPKPSEPRIVLFILGLGVVTGLVRTLFSVNDWVPYFHLQLAHFPQYILMMWAGVSAAKHGWLEPISSAWGWRWLGIAFGFIVVVFPTLFFLGGAASGNLEPFMGGWHWQSFAYALYEQIVGISMILGLLGVFKGILNVSNPFLTALSGSAYAVYVFHSIIILSVSWAAAPLKTGMLTKFIILAGPSLAACFLFGWLIRKAPFVSKIL